MKKGTPVQERFDDKWTPEPNSGCWLWYGARDRDGYGIFQVSTRNPCRAHRFSYESAKGGVPQGLRVLHKCDMPPCVNPDHLFLGDDKANQIDSARKGRCGSQKITIEQVKEIRARWKSGDATQAAMCAEYGLSVGMMSSLISGRKWAHVDL